MIKCYDQIIKMVEIEKLEFMERRSSSEIRLKGDEGRLFKLLKEGPSREMKPAMIYQVMKGLTNQSNEYTDKLKSEATEIAKRVIDTVGKSLLEMKRLWGAVNEVKKEKEIVRVVVEIEKPQESVDFRFSSEMCRTTMQVLSNDKVIKKTVEGN